MPIKIPRKPRYMSVTGEFGTTYVPAQSTGFTVAAPQKGPRAASYCSSGLGKTCCPLFWIGCRHTRQVLFNRGVYGACKKHSKFHLAFFLINLHILLF